mgnify:CR=1
MSGVHDRDEVPHGVVGFELHDRRVLFELPLPARSEFANKVDGRSKRLRPNPRATDDWERACREKWRALALAIKAKLVSYESKVETFEEAFLAQIVVPGKNKAVRFSTLALPAISEAYSGKALPPLLGGGT